MTKDEENAMNELVSEINRHNEGCYSVNEGLKRYYLWNEQPRYNTKAFEDLSPFWSYGKGEERKALL